MNDKTDLTLDRIFADQTFKEENFEDAYHKLFEELVKKKVYPWVSLTGNMSLETFEDTRVDVINSDDDFRYAPLIIVGNAEMRSKEKRLKDIDDLRICKYCGKRYYKWPWSMKRNCKCLDITSLKPGYPWNQIQNLKRMKDVIESINS